MKTLVPQWCFAGNVTALQSRLWMSWACVGVPMYLLGLWFGNEASTYVRLANSVIILHWWFFEVARMRSVCEMHTATILVPRYAKLWTGRILASSVLAALLLTFSAHTAWHVAAILTLAALSDLSPRVWRHRLSPVLALVVATLLALAAKSEWSWLLASARDVGNIANEFVLAFWGLSLVTLGRIVPGLAVGIGVVGFALLAESGSHCDMTGYASYGVVGKACAVNVPLALFQFVSVVSALLLTVGRLVMPGLDRTDIRRLQRVMESIRRQIPRATVSAQAPFGRRAQDAVCGFLGKKTLWDHDDLVILLLVLLPILLLIWFACGGAVNDHPDFRASSLRVTLAGMSGVLIVAAALPDIVAAVFATRREQAFLPLIPGMPQGRTLNRAFLTILLKRTLTATLLAAVIATVFAYLAGQRERIFYLAPMMLVATLPPLILFVFGAIGQRALFVRRDFRLHGISGNVTIMLAPTFLAIQFWPKRTHELEFPMVALAITVTLLLLAWAVMRYRKLLNGPPLLPAQGHDD